MNRYFMYARPAPISPTTSILYVPSTVMYICVVLYFRVVFRWFIRKIFVLPHALLAIITEPIFQRLNPETH